MKFVIEHFIRNKDKIWKNKFGKIPGDKDFMLDNHYFHGLTESTIGQWIFYMRNYRYSLEETREEFQLIKDEWSCTE